MMDKGFCLLRFIASLLCLHEDIFRIRDHSVKTQTCKIAIQLRKALTLVDIDRFTIHGIDKAELYKVRIDLNRMLSVSGAGISQIYAGKIVKIRVALKGLLTVVVDQPDGLLQIGLFFYFRLNFLCLRRCRDRLPLLSKQGVGSLPVGNESR